MRKLWKRIVSLSRRHRVALAGLTAFGWVLVYTGVMEDIGFGLGWIWAWINT